MHSIAWWPNVAVLTIASGIDLRSRRIPNWLAIPFLVAGLVTRCLTGGWSGAWDSVEGIALAALLFGVPCLLRGMGMGDLKLAAGVGAWVGPGQFFVAWIVTSIVGACFAVGYAAWRGCLGKCLDNTNTLLAHFAKFHARPHQNIRIEDKNSISIPYAPAIAIGTLFSFFAQ